jgi:septal ring factor EnvC (AmiA/AmiB activator)
LTESDAKLVDDVARAEDRVAAQRARLKAAEREAEVTTAQLEEQRQLILATREERQAAITRIAQERALQERAEKELEHQRAELAKLIDRLADEAKKLAAEEARRLAEEARRKAQPPPPPVRHGKGMLAKKLPWPTEGLVIRRYGVIVEKDTKAEIVSNGIEIRAEEGAPIVAVADARVVHVGWLRGFGRIVLLDHGEGHHTLHAHLSRASVATGDTVRRGQTIGFVGDTESTNGSKLYFELRENGRPKDPGPYLR